ncbi:Dihydroneopterin aldolase-domain-containing protein [Infundibulicybe gibba]|nr:Dihydroneopterin aldolase-domain-containing protein [Infundibulicybe gibba]
MFDPNAPTDIVSVDSLHLSATLGADCWGRMRPQPLVLTLYLHLRPGHLTSTGETDNLAHSVNYGTICKAAFLLAGGAASAVRVVLELPKRILLADSFSMDMTIPQSHSVFDSPRTTRITNLTLSVIIGVNPPEREAKQRVVTNIVLHEGTSHQGSVDHPALVTHVVKRMEGTAYLTLEKFVLTIVREVCLYSPRIQAATVRAQKPSALSFAHSSGVEITRQRSAFKAA